MGSFNQDSLKTLKELARIHCSPEEDSLLLEGIQKVLNHAEKLQSIDTEGVSPTDTVLQSEPIDAFREDQVGEILPRKVFLDNAPDQVGGMIRTPQVMETQES